MKLHEYQARKLINDFGIPASHGEPVFDVKDTASVFSRVAHPTCMAKVQVLAGGRGKAGGVKRVESLKDAEAFCLKFLGRPFATTQSGGEGKIVKAILLAEDINITEEYYLGVVVDRGERKPVLLFSKEGGVEIEEVAAKNPAAIKKLHFMPDALPSEAQTLSLVLKEFSDPEIAKQIARIACGLTRLFVEKDAAICEINPLVLNDKGRVLALDAKIVFDDNALYRHEDLKALKDPEEDDARERKAKDVGLNYVSMSGNVGCLVNGAGLAMATMDMIKLAGGEPSNFLDVGGGATADQVREGFKIILQDERVEAILVNIFGGIMKCDVIAEGIISASREIRLSVPLVVRLEGTRVEEGRAILKNSDLKIISCHSLKEAAQTVVREAAAYRKSHVHSH
ncbi:MAG TPA: ADP-forming succinate--CoA ligase subunit beta [Candidatus Omnitrophota bacterium]|nr:ADP-forming succinate--CoA ligase subunit beta [Candidatus Omnitrophota bacterium]